MIELLQRSKAFSNNLVYNIFISTASVSLSFGWKSVSVSAVLGLGNGNGVGSGFRVPSNGRWKIYTDMTYKVSLANIWGHPYNSPEGTWVRVDAAPIKTYHGDNTRLIKQ